MDKKKLLKTLRRLSIPRKTTLPSLRRVLIQSSDDGLHFHTTDLDTGTSVFLSTKHPRKVDVVVDLTGLIDNIKSIDDGANITFRSKVFVKKDCEFTIHAGDIDLHMDAWDRDHFPSLPEIPKVKGVDVTKDFISDLVELKKFAADLSEVRSSLIGVFCNLENGDLVATNGCFMALIKDSVRLSESVIIPAMSITKMKKLLGPSKEINIKIKGTMLCAVAEDCHASVLLVDEKYPPYEKVFPGRRHETLESLVLDHEFIKAMPDMKKYELCQIPIFSPSLDDIKVNALLRAETPEGKPRPWNKTIPLNGSTISDRVQFNPDMMKTCCKFVGGNTITLNMKDVNSASLIEHGDRTALIMPTRLPY